MLERARAEVAALASRRQDITTQLGHLSGVIDALAVPEKAATPDPSTDSPSADSTPDDATPHDSTPHDSSTTDAPSHHQDRNDHE